MPVEPQVHPLTGSLSRQKNNNTTKRGLDGPRKTGLLAYSPRRGGVLLVWPWRGALRDATPRGLSQPDVARSLSSLGAKRRRRTKYKQPKTPVTGPIDRLIDQDGTAYSENRGPSPRPRHSSLALSPYQCGCSDPSTLDQAAGHCTQL